MATWLKPPLTDKDKNYEVEWGLHLLLDVDDPRDKKQPIFGAPDEVLAAKLPPELMKKLFGENRELFVICSNGTTAVTVALSNSASPSHVRLVTMGSYTGAYSFTEKYSSVPVDIDDFYNRSSLSLERIVVLPYLMRSEVGTPDANKYEDRCISALQERMLAFAWRGTPVGSLCLELILSGNGLQLSRRFCEKLRTFCTKTGVAIIADEILTGFRCVANPTVLLSDFLQLNPDFIVLGKFIGCGVVLQDKSMKTTSWTSREKRRYPTTNCPMITVDRLSAVLHKFVDLVHVDPQVYNKVGDVVAGVFPSAEGLGLIWFIEDNKTRAVPAPQGVKRLLFKVMRCSERELMQLEQRLRNLSLGPKPRGVSMGSLGRHITKFRSVSREFVINWPPGRSTMFINKTPHVFGLAYATRVWVGNDIQFTRKTQLYSFVMGKVPPPPLPPQELL